MEINSVITAVVPECKIVTVASIARKLLRDGFTIIDIKPKKGHPRESVFVFEVSKDFLEKYNVYISEWKSVKEEKIEYAACRQNNN